jgi:hypothetical protein
MASLSSMPAQPPTPDRLLEIYLADHLAAATAGMALARRSARRNAGTEFGGVLDPLAEEIESDRRRLQQIIEQLGFRRSKAKEAVAWAGEKVGRLKPNGQIRGYSRLSRVLELEALSVGVAGKLALWESLLAVRTIGERLSGIDLEQLAERARRQRAEIEASRLRAAHEAFDAVIGPTFGDERR